jgi:Amt family ammonium transporter
VLVVLSVVAFDKLRLDDPVGALSVHGTCGIWGTLAVGIFGAKAGTAQLVSQLIGIAAIGVASFAFAFVVFLVLKVTVGIRVSEVEEIEGLDLGEHGMRAYPDFAGDAWPNPATPRSSAAPRGAVVQAWFPRSEP